MNSAIGLGSADIVDWITRLLVGLYFHVWKWGLDKSIDKVVI